MVSSKDCNCPKLLNLSEVASMSILAGNQEELSLNPEQML
jgi:hypothetical protein